MKKKSAVHDYAIEAFRFYAREGGPGFFAPHRRTNVLKSGTR